MRPVTRSSRVVASVLAASLVAACSSAAINSLAYREPCSGHACRVSISNHSLADLSARYADSTGRRELVGLVRPSEIKTFTVQWVHSAGIRIFASSKQYGLYAADVAFDRARPVTEVHYPDDFSPVTDTVGPARSPR